MQYRNINNIIIVAEL